MGRKERTRENTVSISCICQALPAHTRCRGPAALQGRTCPGHPPPCRALRHPGSPVLPGTPVKLGQTDSVGSQPSHRTPSLPIKSKNVFLQLLKDPAEFVNTSLYVLKEYSHEYRYVCLPVVFQDISKPTRGWHYPYTLYHFDARPRGKSKCIIYLEIIDLLLISFQMGPSTTLF